MSEFVRKTVWFKRVYCGGVVPCSVEVCHKFVEGSDLRPGRNLWTVYGYVYPTHRRFGEWSASGGEDALRKCDPPGHGDVTLFRVYRVDSVEITALQFGFDYDHLYDEDHRECPVEFPEQYLRDAERLGLWLLSQHGEASDG